MNMNDCRCVRGHTVDLIEKFCDGGASSRQVARQHVVHNEKVSVGREAPRCRQSCQLTHAGRLASSLESFVGHQVHREVRVSSDYHQKSRGISQGNQRRYPSLTSSTQGRRVCTPLTYVATVVSVPPGVCPFSFLPHRPPFFSLLCMYVPRLTSTRATCWECMGGLVSATHTALPVAGTPR